MSLALRSSITALLVVLLLRVTQPAPVDNLTHWQPPSYSQSEFPCREDEVLGYGPSFGPDRVGCISLDLIPD